MVQRFISFVFHSFGLFAAFGHLGTLVCLAPFLAKHLKNVFVHAGSALLFGGNAEPEFLAVSRQLTRVVAGTFGQIGRLLA